MLFRSIFDMDGVLTDTERWLNRYWRQAAGEAGYQMSREQALTLRSMAGEYAGPYLKELFGAAFPYEQVRARRRELMSRHIEENGVERKTGAKDLLDYLRANDIRTAVATATDPVRTKDYLTRAGIYEKFDHIICAAMVAHGKPAPDIYRYACAQIKERPEDCIAVEDSPNGVCAAAGAGLRTIMVPDLTRPDDKTGKMLMAEVDTLYDIILMIEDGLL